MYLYLLFEIPSNDEDPWDLCAEIEQTALGAYSTLKEAMENAHIFYGLHNNYDFSLEINRNKDHNDSWFIDVVSKHDGKTDYQTVFAIRELVLNAPVLTQEFIGVT